MIIPMLNILMIRILNKGFFSCINVLKPDIHNIKRSQLDESDDFSGRISQTRGKDDMVILDALQEEVLLILCLRSRTPSMPSYSLVKVAKEKAKDSLTVRDQR